MEDHPVILVTPLCIQGKVDIPSLRGLIDIFAMNLQSYEDIEVRAPMFFGDNVDRPQDDWYHRLVVWGAPYRYEDVWNLLEQCGHDITHVIIPTAQVEHEQEDSTRLTFQIKILNMAGDFEIYNQSWNGNLLDVLAGLSQALPDVAHEVGSQNPGQTKWPLSENPEAIQLFLQGVSTATAFYLGIQKNIFDKVISYLLKAFELDNQLHLSVYHLVGFLESIASSPDFPLRVYQKCRSLLQQVEKLPNLPGHLHLLIADLYKNFGTRGVEKNIKAAMTKSPDDPSVIIAAGNYYEEQNQWGRAKNVYQRYISQYGKKSPSHLVLHNLGTIYAEEGSVEKAIDIWCQALRLERSYSTTYVNLMNAYLETGEYGKMWVVLEEALKFPPIPWHSYENVVHHLHQIGDFSAGVQAVEEYIRKNPQDQGAYLFLGAALYRLEKNDRAIEVLAAGLEIEDDPEFSQEIGRILLTLKIPDFENKFEECYQNLAKGQDKSTIPFLKECTKCVKSFWPVWLLLAKIYQQHKQYAKAMRAMKRAHKFAPDRPDILNEIGVIASQMDRHDSATRYFLRALELDPFHTDYLCNAALELAKSGDTEHAKQKIQRALWIKPDNPFAKDILSILQGKKKANADGTISPASEYSPKKRKK